MSWMQQVCETYAYACTTTAPLDAENPLATVGFSTDTVSIVLRLDAKGQFLDAERLPEPNIQVIPTTLHSVAGRSGDASPPHPLVDKIKYLGTPAHLALLDAWCACTHTPPCICAYRDYLAKGTLHADICQCFAQKAYKTDKLTSEKVLVCMPTTDPNERDNLCLRPSVRASWEQFFEEDCDKEAKALCAVLGEVLPAMNNHPYLYETCRLISQSKSKTGKRCEGRFQSKPELALSLSVRASYQIHNTLRWLLGKDTPYLYGTRLLIWDTAGQALPDITSFDPYEDEEDESETQTPFLGTLLRQAVAKGASGYFSTPLPQYHAQQIKTATVVVLALDAISNGRTALVYYQALHGADYLANLLHWYEGFSWMQLGKTGKATRYSPLPRDIGNLLYGTGKDQSIRNLKNNLMKRLLPCITNRAPLPVSLLQQGFRKLCQPLSYSRNQRFHRKDWETALGVVCALGHKIDFDKGEDASMECNPKDFDRSYLYGRLLACADIIERNALRQGEKERTTNAMRYLQRFQNRPAETWLFLRTQKIEPYLQALSPALAQYYRREINDIQASFQDNDIGLPEPLSVRMLQGYSCQMQWFYTKKEETP